MKKYIKYIVSALCALALTSAALAASEDTSLFNAKEIGLSLGTGYVVDTAAAFQQDYSFNLNAGAFYFPFRNFGAEVNVPFYQTKGVSVSEVQAGTLFRLPLSKTVSLFKNISPYVGAGGVYNWNAAQEWAYIAKAGIELRLNKNWGFGIEGQYRNNEFSKWDTGAVSVVGALKLVL